MATRATYKFSSKSANDGEVFIYNHWDNYPAGAAEHFFQALVHAGEYGVLRAESFIRGNERAEITESHDIHGDTEYRYDIDVAEQEVTVFQRDIRFHADGSYTESWEFFAHLDVKEFIIKYRNSEAA